MSRTSALLASLSVLVAVVVLPGCSNKPPGEGEMTQDEQIRYGLGYYEVNHDGTTYVVGSDEAASNVKAGKLPKNTVHRFSAGGRRVLIDADDSATRARLEHEYDRRHGLK